MIPALTLAALVVFQALFILFSPVQSHWEVYVACVAIDGTLLGAFLRDAATKRSGEQERFQRATEELQSVFELTLEQQRLWRASVEALSRIEPGDTGNGKEIKELVAGLNTEKGRKLVAGEEGVTIEKMVDSIQALILLNHSLTEDMNSALDVYRNLYLQLKKIQKEYKLNHLRLRETVDFVETMGIQTNDYSEKLVLEVLESFQKITRFSEDIGNDVMGRIRSLMDPTNAESLDAIIRGSAGIHQTMDEFFLALGNANASSEKVVRDNLAQMVRVREMAEAIADFSESIRMISLNLNIEAARCTQQGGGEGRSFQVLATKLSEFAVRARELAEHQNATIQTASAVMTNSGTSQTTQLAGLMEAIPQIKAQLDPFEAVVRGSYTQFESVAQTMEKLSGSINDRLKAVIGKFQFQDLVRQEQEHILALFAHIRDLAEQIEDRDDLDAATKTQTREALLNRFEAMSSTENERAVLRAYRKQAGLTLDGDADVTAGSVSLF